MSRTMSGLGQRCRSRIVLSLMAGLFSMAVAMPAMAQGGPTPPDLTVCDAVTCENLPEKNVCSDAGFKISLKSYTPASTQNSGMASYVYEICSPLAGVCSGDGTTSCLDNEQCTKGGNPAGGTCTRECAADTFRDLSHFDVTFPELGGLNSCLSSNTSVTGSCKVVDNAPQGDGSITGGFVLGDGSCFDGGTSQSLVAKCDGTKIKPGDCVEMTLNIAGETEGLGKGATVVVDKEATTCTSSCLAGPSCAPCDTEPPGEACLTRTIGFWGTHPWITNDYDPVTVCGQPLDCNDPQDGKSDPSCGAGSCNDIMEGLGSVGGENPKKSAYISMVKQLTAAKLNLNATDKLFPGSTCTSWTYQNKTIGAWISECEALCGANQATISGSGCIEALNEFNNSEDTGFTVTPSPFDRPPVDDFGNVSGADSSGFTKAQGSKGDKKLVIGTECVPQ